MYVCSNLCREYATSVSVRMIFDCTMVDTPKPWAVTFRYSGFRFLVLAWEGIGNAVNFWVYQKMLQLFS